MAYTTVNKSTGHFNTKLYTSTGNDNLAITGVGFEPSLTWIKKRNVVSGSDTNEWHMWADQVRGSGYYIGSNSDSAQTSTTNDLKSWQSDGFTLGTVNRVNQGSTPHTYASWNWKGNGTGSANTDGSINSTVSANPTAGFSIVKYTGNANVSTVGHGLGVPPKIIITKNLSRTDAWPVDARIGAGGIYYLNQTDGTGAYGNTSPYPSTAPTNSVYSIGTAGNTNYSGSDLISYCFAQKRGFSSMGTFTGSTDSGTNGSIDDAFIFTGFKVAWLLVKKINAGGTGWFIFDNKRDVDNPISRFLMAQAQNPEDNNLNRSFDLLSNGFKSRGSSDDTSGSGSTYIYMAFAEAPLVGTNNVPCTAR